MGNPSLSVRFTIFLSLTLTSSSSPSPSSILFSKPPPSSSSSALSIPKATPSDLLSVLGPATQSSKINPLISQQLNSCLKFLVPFKRQPNARHVERRSLSSHPCSNFRRSRREENELVWWPPEPVLELARLAVDSGGDPHAIHGILDPTVLPVPDCEGSKENTCELTRTAYGRRFIYEELNSYLEFLFELIVARGPAVGLNTKLNRYDLFHGHLFISDDTGRVGILKELVNYVRENYKLQRDNRFHAKEYPVYDKEVFPCNMGYCQKGSTVTYNEEMNFYETFSGWLLCQAIPIILGWLQTQYFISLFSLRITLRIAKGVLVVLDAHPEGIIYRDLIPEYVQIARTIYEDDLGALVVDVNYLNVGDGVPNYQIFMC